MSEENQTPEQVAGGENAAQPQFSIKRVYVKDLSFEAPQGAKAFTTQWQPKVSQDLNTQIDRLDEGHFEVVLKMTVTVKMDEEKTAFLAEVHQAGIFEVKGVDGVPLQHMLTSACPQILFPYAREAIDNLAVRGGFPPLNLPPVNFDALFAQAVAKAQAEAKVAEEAGETQ
ncbi:protein-export chaperone SecB [Teredinibacter franksiae]|jgi:protein translocase subunit secB|uniref:protein-export chaperone SecB n=1 Tax=Teredinibacter franksiae TaxID=2761453 RepID=UPI001623EFF8|nr:protein-export chaperone SecB [Teredinibacter franksiae]